MARHGRRSIWERLVRESSDSTTVTITLPREQAEQLMGLLMSSLEIDGGGEDGGDDFSDLDEPGDEADLPAFMDGGDDEVPDFSADDDATDDEDDDDDTAAADDDDDDDKKESADSAYGKPRPGTALGEQRQHRRWT